MKKKFSLLLTLLLALALLAGCGSATPEPAETPEPTPTPLTAAEIVEKLQAALLETPCSKCVVNMDMDFTVDAGQAGNMDMTVATVSDITVCDDPVASYSTVTMELGFDGETEQTESETYVLLENGKPVGYANTDGIWLKMAIGQTPEELLRSAAAVEVDSTTAEVDDAVTTWDGKDAICLTTEIRGESLADVVGGILSGMQENGGAVGEAAELVNSMDYSALVCHARLYLDPETYLPMAEEMDFDGMTEVMAPIYAEMGADVTVEVTACSGTAVYTSYEPQAEIVLPEGVAEAAELWTRQLSGEPDNGDGTFTIREGSVLADIVSPEGFTLKEKDYDHVLFTREDHRTVCYTMFYLYGTDNTGPDFTALVDSTVARYETGGGKVERETTGMSAAHLNYICDILGTTWGDGSEEADIFAWSPLAKDGEGIYYIFVEISDGFDDGLGNSKNADITPEEVTALLDAAALNKLMQ